MTVTQVEAGPEQLSYTTRKAYCSPCRRRRHRVGAAQQVVKTLLMVGILELVIRGPAVVDHRAVVVEPQDGRGHGTAAVGSMT